MKKVYAAANLAEAHLLLHLLAEHGIPARVFNEFAQGAAGEIPFVHAYPEIWVEREADAGRAQAVLDEYERRPPVHASRPCPACGEPNPANFEICWRCGGPFPDA